MFPLPVNNLQLNVVHNDRVNKGEERRTAEDQVSQSCKLNKFRLYQERNKQTGSTVQKLRGGWLPECLNLWTDIHYQQWQHASQPCYGAHKILCFQMPLRGTNNFLKHAACLKKLFFQHDCRNRGRDSNGDTKVTSLASLSYLTESGNDEVNKFNLLTLEFSQVCRDDGVTSWRKAPSEGYRRLPVLKC